MKINGVSVYNHSYNNVTNLKQQVNFNGYLQMPDIFKKLCWHEEDKYSDFMHRWQETLPTGTGVEFFYKAKEGDYLFYDVETVVNTKGRNYRKKLKDVLLLSTFAILNKDGTYNRDDWRRKRNIEGNESNLYNCLYECIEQINYLLR